MSGSLLPARLLRCVCVCVCVWVVCVCARKPASACVMQGCVRTPYVHAYIKTAWGISQRALPVLATVSLQADVPCVLSLTHTHAHPLGCKRS